MNKQGKTAEQSIAEHLNDNGQKLTWLAKKIGVTSAHLFFVLKAEDNKKRELTQSNLDKINEALRTNFIKE